MPPYTKLWDTIGKSDLGTLKLLQALLAKYTDETYAYNRMTPLFGVYELRGADAHLSNSGVEECYAKLSVDRSAPFVKQAELRIMNVAKAFGVTGGELERHVPDP